MPKKEDTKKIIIESKIDELEILVESHPESEECIFFCMESLPKQDKKKYNAIKCFQSRAEELIAKF